MRSIIVEKTQNAHIGVSNLDRGIKNLVIEAGQRRCLRAPGLEVTSSDKMIGFFVACCHCFCDPQVARVDGRDVIMTVVDRRGRRLRSRLWESYTMGAIRATVTCANANILHLFGDDGRRAAADYLSRVLAP